MCGGGPRCGKAKKNADKTVEYKEAFDEVVKEIPRCSRPKNVVPSCPPVGACARGGPSSEDP